LSSAGGTGSHLKWRPQLKPPRTTGEGEYTSVSAEMMSMTGQTTVRWSRRSSSSSGCSHAAFTSQWLSRNISTSPGEGDTHTRTHTRTHT